MGYFNYSQLGKIEAFVCNAVVSVKEFVLVEELAFDDRREISQEICISRRNFGDFSEEEESKCEVLLVEPPKHFEQMLG
jgi:hypothetical protein